MKKLLKWITVRAEEVEKDADPGAMSAMANAVLSAAYSAAQDMNLNLDGGFSMSPIADQDGDSDGDGATLFCVCMANTDFYVLASGESAEVIAYYSYADVYMSCREDIGEELLKQESAAESKEERDAAVLRAAKPRKRPTAGMYKLAKADDAQRYTLGVAYPHDEVDAHGDFTDDVELELAAWTFMRSVVAKGDAGVGLDHADGTDGAAEVVESYIYRGPDWEVEGVTVAKAGDWMVGAIWTEEAWDSIVKGERVGWSIQGLAFRVEDEDESGGQ